MTVEAWSDNVLAMRHRSARASWMIAGIALAVSACERAEPTADARTGLTAAEVGQPEGWDADLVLPTPPDLSPDPNVLEVELEAKVATVDLGADVRTTAWTYNGLLPGPLLRAKLGDRLIVHFKNSLPEATTIHWHGLRVPNDMDGAPGYTQPPVAPGGTFRYEFTLEDSGTYWYHPHMNSSAQVGRGLYGPIVVEDPNDPPGLGDELVLVLSDLGLDANDELLPPDTGGKFGDLFGREGSVLLVNGKIRPTLKVRAGKQQRWRVINAARARYYHLRLRDHRFIRLGGDNGLAARSEDVYGVLVTPGERTDVVFTPASKPGSRTMLRWMPTDRGYGSTYNRSSQDMFVIETVDLPPVAPLPIPAELRDIPRIATESAVHHEIALTIQLGNDDVVMGINGVPYPQAKPLEVRLGETHVWRIVNDTDFAHPFHLHGYFFQVLDDTRVPEWKDTVNVASKSELSIAVVFDERPGLWMYHCHILDHAEVGMMGHLHVRSADAAPVEARGVHSPAHPGH